MSQKSDLVNAALTAANTTVTSLQKLQVDIAKADSAIATQLQHSTDAATQAATDAAAVNVTSTSIVDDLSAVAASKAVADAALDALSALSPVSPTTQSPETTTTTTDPNVLTTVPPQA